MKTTTETDETQHHPAPSDKTAGERFLDVGHRLVLHGHQIMGMLFPTGRNPFARSGAIANTLLIIAVVTGILLLIWYKPSVVQAYDSMEAISQMTFTAQLMRSLHRYSSDGCMFFVVIHALQLFMAGRFSGTRWLAWMTGVLAMTLLWAVGWTGYWLVWDERGQMVAVETAKVLDLVPIFSDPMSRSFLTNDSVNSLFFFVIFFFHMLVPLAMGVALWLHIVRLSRPEFLTDRNTTIWITGTLVLLSFLVPAEHVARADMLLTPQTFTMDWWYLTPVWIVDRLSGGAFWAMFLIMGGLLYSLPFWRLTRKRKAAEVVESRCNACQKCFVDCPYDAITMVPRTDNLNFDAQAQVNPDQCVACGICSGSCNSAGIGLPDLPVFPVRKQLEALMTDDAWYAFVCRESAALDVNPEDGSCKQLPGYKVQTVPCIGWLHALTVERLIRKGAKGVLLAACGDETCKYREGVAWTRQRFAGEREPYFRPDKADPDKFRLVALENGGMEKLAREAQIFRDGESMNVARKARPLILAIVATVLITITMMLPVNIPYTPAAGSTPQFVVSFKHGGAAKEARTLTQEELDKLPVHMRQATVSERGRAAVRLRVEIDGTERVNQSYKPSGFMGDGTSIALERMALEPGEHHIRIWLGDTADEQEWNHHVEKNLVMEPYKRTVLLFDQANGFTWHEPE